MTQPVNPVTPDELRQWEQETLAIILRFANQIVYQRECEVINARVNWDPDSEPMDEYRAAQRHERRRVMAGLPARGYQATRVVEGWALMTISDGAKSP
jgi:hypothetical protein